MAKRYDTIRDVCESSMKSWGTFSVSQFAQTYSVPRRTVSEWVNKLMKKKKALCLKVYSRYGDALFSQERFSREHGVDRKIVNDWVVGFRKELSDIVSNMLNKQYNVIEFRPDLTGKPQKFKGAIEFVPLKEEDRPRIKGTISYPKMTIQTNTTAQEGVHLYIPDTQVKAGIDLSYLTWIGKYIVRKKPDVIVMGGDFADMPSLSSYDKGKKSAEGRRVADDIAASKKGMYMMLEPLYRLQQLEIATYGEVRYKPRMVLTLGNHEDRLTRYVNDNPELHGQLGIDSLGFEEFGWEVIPFLTPIEIGGIYYIHYLQNVMTGKPLAGTAANMLKTVGRSFTMGHRQQLDVATRFLQVDGTQQWGLVAGAAYIHEEDYKGVQGNHHARVIVVKHNVKNGSYDPLFVSMDWLKKEYS